MLGCPRRPIGDGDCGRLGGGPPSFGAMAGLRSRTILRGPFQLEPCRLPDADWLREKYSLNCEGGFDSHIRLSAPSRSSALSTM